MGVGPTGGPPQVRLALWPEPAATVRGTRELGTGEGVGTERG